MTLSRARCTARRSAVAFVEGEDTRFGANKVDELVEDEELKAQLDTVDGSFEDGLDAEEVCKFRRKQSGIQEDDESIDPDQVFEDLADFAFLEYLAGPQHLAGLVEVET